MKGKELADQTSLLIVLLILPESNIESFHFIFFVEVVVDQNIEAKNEVIEAILVVEEVVDSKDDNPNNSENGIKDNGMSKIEFSK